MNVMLLMNHEEKRNKSLSQKVKNMGVAPRVNSQVKHLLRLFSSKKGRSLSQNLRAKHGVCVLDEAILWLLKMSPAEVCKTSACVASWQPLIMQLLGICEVRKKEGD